MSDTERKDKPRARGKFGNREIIDAVRDAVLKAGSSRVADLAAELGVSEVSIRKSLDVLEREGIIRRFHGEARIYKGDDIPFRMHLHYAEKQAIASRAATLVEPGDTILLEAGSAIAMFAERIRDVRNLTVITPNLFIARSFRGSKARVILPGGLYQEECESLVGPATCESVRSFGFSKAFIGVSGFTIAGGFMLNDVERAEVTRTILDRCAECRAASYILTDSSKFGVSHAAQICSDLSLVSGVVTDSGIPDACRRYFEESGVEVLS
jgi:DeoR/GlpR family transcriptional regulator of sugar metabolism